MKNEHKNCVYGKGPTPKKWFVIIWLLGAVPSILFGAWLADRDGITANAVSDATSSVLELFKDTPDKFQEQQILDALTEQRDAENLFLSLQTALDTELELEEEFSNANPPEVGTEEYYRLHPREFPTKQRAEEIIDEIYDVAGLAEFWDTQLLFEIIECESSWRQFVPGLAGEVGLYQYYLKWHPDIDKQCAENIRCATDYAIKLIKEGRVNEWSCYAIIIDQWI